MRKILYEIHCEVYSVVAVLLVHYLISLYPLITTAHNYDNVAEKLWLVVSSQLCYVLIYVCVLVYPGLKY